MSKKEVSFSLAIGGILSSSFKAAVTGAKNEFVGLARRMQELENSDINKLGLQFEKQKELLKNLGAELTAAKEKLRLLQSQSKGAGKDTKIFELQVQEAQKEVNSLTYALEKNIAGYQKNIAQIRNTQGSVRSLASEYVKLSQEMEKTQSVQNRFKALQERREQLGAERSRIQGELVQTAVPALALSVPIKQAVEFEAAMADVAKTMDGMRDDDGNLTARYFAMEQAVKNMATSLPLAHEEIAGLFAAAGQQGLTKLSEIENFVTMSAQMAVAFGMSQEQAADAIGGYRSAMGLSFEDTRTMLDLMNQYANTSSATEQDIAEVMRRIGSLGGQAGMAVKPMTALAATLVSMKVSPEEAGTGIKNFLLALTSGKAATKSQTKALNELGFGTEQLAKAMQKDAPKAVLAVLNALKKLPKHEQLSTMQTLFGKESLAVIAPLLGQLDLVAKNLTICADETQYAGAMQKEFSARIRTTQANAQLFSNRIKEASINMGTALLPAMNAVMDNLGPFVSGFADFAEENPAVMKAVVGTAGALVGLKVTTLAAMYAANTLRSAWLTAKGAAYVLSLATNRQTLFLAAQKTALYAGSAATKAITAAQWLWNAAMTANPVGLIVTGLGMATAAMYALYQTCEPVRNAFDWAFSGIASLIQSLWEKLKMLWDGAKSIGQTLGLIDEDVEVNLTAAPLPSSAAYAVSNPMPVFPASLASEKFIAAKETQSVNSSQNTQISVPMHFTVQGLDGKEFAKQMEKARPDIEELVKKVLENLSHQKARINFAN